MNEMAFKWKADSRFPIKAQIAAERLALIKQREGVLTPSHVVADAKPKASPLHACFTWDNTEAADKYRLWEARKLVNSLVVAQLDGNNIDREVRAYVHISADEARYERVDVAMGDDVMSSEVLGKAALELKRWRDRYSALEAFAILISRIDETLEAIG